MHIGFAQHIYSCIPKCNYHHNLKSFFKSVGFNEAKDAYIFHLRPGACPRCEGLMYSIYNQLGNVQKVIVFDVAKSSIAKDYLTRNQIKGKYNYYVDSNQSCYMITNCGDKGLNVPVLYKVLAVSNDFSVIKPLLGAHDSLVAEVLSSDKTIKNCDLNTVIDNSKGNNNFYSRLISLKHDFEDYVVFKIHENRVYLIDAVLNEILVFDLKGNLTNRYKSSEEELWYQMKFVDTGVTRKLIEMGVPKVIYVGVEPGKGFINITASVPSITVNYVGGERNIIYENLPVEIKKATNGKLISIQPLQIDGNDSNLVITHTVRYEINDGIYAYGVLKGWPAVGSDEKSFRILCKTRLWAFFI